MEIDRQHALRYRIMAQGLDRSTPEPGKLAVLDLGVQETNVGSARLALAARLPPGYADPVAGDSVALAWSFRGAPHLHRSADLARLAGALWPVSDADAFARLAAERSPLKAAGISGMEAFGAAAKAMRAAVRRPMAKGDVSAAVTALLPEAYSYRCRGCGSVHVYGGLFQSVALAAGVRLVSDAPRTTLAPMAGRPSLPRRASGIADVMRLYLRLHGPATLAEASSYLGTTQAAVRDEWPDHLVEVRVGGRRAWMPEDSMDALSQAGDRRSASGDGVRLLPPSDPWLQSRDRNLVVPDKARQKAVWKILANPGAVLSGTEIVGTWRARATRSDRLDITVEAFGTLSAASRKAVKAEAERVAAVRDVPDFSVRYGK